MSKEEYAVIHYSEIGLKGRNRSFFENTLIKNLKNLLANGSVVRRNYGKIVVKLKTEHDLEQIQKTLNRIPGIASFAFAKKTELNLASLRKEALALLSQEDFATFGIITRRSNKKFPHTSGEINIILGDLIRKELNKKVNLSKPDLVLKIEISEKDIFLYLKKFKGIGGLPVGSSGRAVALLSGGIDSPVASFMGMKRGLKVIFVHVLNKTMTSGRKGAAKIEKIVKELSKIQARSKLYVVPFEEIQKAIVAYIPAEYSMIVYRRFMMRIAEAIAVKEKAKAIVTGDSVGQVASQTLDNLNCIYDSVNLPVLPPLIGMNKEEIISIAKNIGTYELSIIPYPDCCSFLIAQHPETRGNVKKIEELENLIKDRKLVDKSVKNASNKLVYS